jgi:putative oligomerization/nucleic acid binding protein
MPGLLRGVARTAVVAGTATAVSNRVSRRQYNRWAEQDAQQYAQEPAPAPAAPAAAAVAAPAAGGGEQDRVSALQDLADLKAQGILTDEEFAAEKARILGQ